MKIFCRFFLGIALALLSAGGFSGEMPFSQKTFDDLRAAGKPVVIHVHAAWCGTCRKQTRIVTPLLAEPQFSELTLLRIDYSSEKALLKSLNIPNKSTFVAFNGNTEVGRSIGDTDKERIAALLRKAL